jgi:hypothetical protein
VELGLDATDADYVQFQRSINANVRGAAKERHEILLRKLLRTDPSFVKLFGPTIVAESGLAADIKRIGENIGDLIERVNAKYSSKHGEDLIKATNKTSAALRKLAHPVHGYEEYKELISNLYFVFREGVGGRLDGKLPQSFADVNLLRTDMQHDVDHGKKGAVASKRRKISTAFGKYVSGATPITLEPEHFPIFHAGILNALETDLRKLLEEIR